MNWGLSEIGKGDVCCASTTVDAESINDVSSRARANARGSEKLFRSIWGEKHTLIDNNYL